MVLKRSLNSKSIEELLADLNDTTEDKRVSKKEEKIHYEEDSVLTFLKFYNIEPGNVKIKARYLYKLYKEFTSEPVINYTFNEYLGYYLKSDQTNLKNKVYFINQKVLNLSERALELIKREDKRPSHRAISWKFHFDNFIKKYDLKPGENENWIWVSSSLLYNLYDKWVYEIKKKRGLSKNEFRQLCKAYFQYKEDSNNLWFKIDNSILNHVSKEMDIKIKARNRSLNEKEEKQKK